MLRLNARVFPFPVVFVPVSTCRVRASDSDGNVVLEVATDQVVDITLTSTVAAGRKILHVRQTWPAGAKWWSLYEMIGEDGVELRARRIGPEPENGPMDLKPLWQELQEARNAAYAASRAQASVTAPTEKAGADETLGEPPTQ